MGFQSTVSANQAFGIVGEFANDSARRVAPYILDSADAAYNVVGRAFTVKSEGVAQAGGDAGILAGILVNPKSYASQGGSTGPLAPSLTLRNGDIGELCTFGEIIVNLGGVAAIGDAVKYNDTTGVLGAGAPSTGETAVANARVTGFVVGSNGLAVITLTN